PLAVKLIMPLTTWTVVGAVLDKPVAVKAALNQMLLPAGMAFALKDGAVIDETVDGTVRSSSVSKPRSEVRVRSRRLGRRRFLLLSIFGARRSSLRRKAGSMLEPLDRRGGSNSVRGITKAGARNPDAVAWSALDRQTDRTSGRRQTETLASEADGIG